MEPCFLFVGQTRRSGPVPNLMNDAHPARGVDVGAREQYLSAFDSYRREVEARGGFIVDVVEDHDGLFTWGAQTIDGNVKMLELCYAERFKEAECNYVRLIHAERSVER